MSPLEKCRPYMQDVRMKAVSARVSDSTYAELRMIARMSGRPVAELIRQAMDEYLERHGSSGRSLVDIKPHRGGRLLRRWMRAELFEEMIQR